jgi:hypothetical protein
MTMANLILCDEAGNELEREQRDGRTIYVAARYAHKVLASTPAGQHLGVALLSADGQLNLVPDSQKEGRTLWCLPDRDSRGISKRDKQRLSHTFGAEGTLEYVLLRHGKRLQNEPSVSLERRQSVFDDAAFRKMLDDIGAVALSSLSTVVRNGMKKSIAENKGIDDHGFEMRRIRGSLQFIETVIKFGEVVLRNLSAIAAAPLQSMQKKLIPVRVPSVRPTAREYRMLDQNPAARTMWLPQLNESLDCTENRFIKYVLHAVMDSLIKAAESQSSIAFEDERAFSVFLSSRVVGNQDMEGVAKKHRDQRIEVKKLMQEKNKLLQSIKDRIYQARNCKFWRELPVQESQPELTNRLYGTNGYAQITRDFLHLSRSLDDKLQRITRLLHAIESGGIRATWQLYEIWVFAQLYDAFLSRIGGAKPHGFQFIDFLEWHAGELSIRENAPLKLIVANTCSTSGTLIELRYQVRHTTKEGKSLLPDIQVTVTPPDGDQIVMIFDSKMHLYDRLPDQFVDDVLRVAYQKYFKNLQGILELKGLRSSYIVHPTNVSADSKYVTLGEAPLEEFGIKHSLADKSTDSRPQYRYGALRLRPGFDVQNRDQLTKMIRLIFTYYVGERFDGCCIECGDYANNPPKTIGVGEVYQCLSCAEFWVVTHCKQCKNRLVKFRNRNIHRHRNNRPGEWMFECPICGDDGPDYSTVFR